MNSYVMIQLILFAAFLVLAVVGNKLKKSLSRDAVYSLAATLLFICIVAVFTNRIELWLFFSMWIIPVGLSSTLKEEHVKTYRILLSVGSIWFLGLIAYAILMFINYALVNPMILIPSFFLLCFSILIVWIYRSVFVPSEKLRNLLELSGFIRRIKSKITLSMFLSLLIPLLIFLLSPMVNLTFETQILISVYSTILQVISTLLGIVVAVTLFLLSSTRGRPWHDILRRGVEGLSALYAITLLVSMIGLLSVPSKSLHIDFAEASLDVVYWETVFIFVIGLFAASIVYLIMIFAEIVDMSSK